MSLPLLSRVIFTGYFMWSIEVGSPLLSLGFDNQVKDEDEPEDFWNDFPVG